MHRTQFLRGAAGAAALALAGALCPAQAQTYPQKPIRIIVPFAAGGAADIVARTLAEKMSPRLGQPVIVDNRSGGSGTIGVDAVAKSPGDGYTLSLALSSQLMINQYLFKKLPYDSQKDLVLVAKVADSPLVLLVNANVPASNGAELRKYLTANKGKLSYGSWGIGTVAHLTASHLSEIVGADMTHVAYRGEVPMLQDLVGGNLPMSFATTVQAGQFISAGRVKAIGVTGTTRIGSLPKIPTLVEAGFDDQIFRAVGWIGLSAPAATPKAVVQRISDEVRAALSLPDVQQRIKDLGWAPSYLGPADFAATYQRELPLWKGLVKQSGATLD
ncbi:Bug family tripartite tricarboxylate transporter substrate binding protein [Cupriavidus sp. 2TAF22]|uniref:Bug family tripartite tricarboxylate transporter substrate binding protein n=1 Tax=unclassified Cupriavidus TaxID=2640874 RepID=UPI003F8F17A9